MDVGVGIGDWDWDWDWRHGRGYLSTVSQGQIGQSRSEQSTAGFPISSLEKKILFSFLFFSFLSFSCFHYPYFTHGYNYMRRDRKHPRYV